jgi:hypothetical protein
VKLDPEERVLRDQIHSQLKAAGQYRFARGYPPHPPCKDMEQAAEQLLGRLEPDQVILSMRDQCLLPFIRLAMSRGHQVVIPDKDAREVYGLPRSEPVNPDGTPKKIKLHPLPHGKFVWRSHVDVVVVACTAWSAGQRALWTVDGLHTAAVLDSLYEGVRTVGGAVRGPGMESTVYCPWRLPRDTLTVCLAADE